MNWLTWHNPKSGNRTTRAHLVSSFVASRTECGWSVGTLTAPAGRAIPRCQACEKAAGEIKKKGRYP